MNRKLKTLAVLSVLLNVLLFGFIAGNASRYMLLPPPPPPSVDNLPSEKREQFEHAMQNLRKETDPIRDQLRAAKQENARILKADKFDKDAYMAQMHKIHDLHGQLATRMAETVAGLAATATPEERAALADMFRGPPPPPPGNGPPPPPPGDAPPPPPPM